MRRCLLAAFTISGPVTLLTYTLTLEGADSFPVTVNTSRSIAITKRYAKLKDISLSTELRASGGPQPSETVRDGG